MKVLVGGVIAFVATMYAIKKLLNRRYQPAVSDLDASPDAREPGIAGTTNTSTRSSVRPGQTQRTSDLLAFRNLARGWNVKGRRSFTRDDIEKLRRLIRRKETANRPAQKILRSKMRQMGFYISDFERDHSGFTTSDLDHLVTSGIIEIKQ